jgi:trimeric autotransporter adhesin
MRLKSLTNGYASVTATVALVLALGLGGAYAAQKITSKSITPGAIKSKHIKDGNVRTNDLGVNAVTSDRLATDSVDSLHIQNGTVGSAEIGVETVGSFHLKPDSVNGAQIGPDAVGAAEIAADSVGGSELRGVTTVHSEGVQVGPGGAANAFAVCSGGKVVLAGGFAWQDDSQATIVASAPSETTPHRTWVVRGHIPSGGTGNTLYAWATCLDA